jgi:amino acid adenylation domain-containing protein
MPEALSAARRWGQDPQPTGTPSVAEQFETVAEAHAARTAIVDGASSCTYRQLNERANRVAHGLLRRRLPEDRPVALMLSQGSSFIAGLLGVLKAGGFFVPLDPANPPARNAQMLEDSGASCVIAERAYAALAAEAATEHCPVVETEQLALGMPAENPRMEVPDDALAYVLYTSGSTGRPKGVMQDQRSVLHNMRRHLEVFHITPEDRQTLLYTCSVYGGIRDVFNALLNGASLHVYSVKDRGTLGLAEWLRSSGITIYCSVATVFRQFVASLRPDEGFPAIRFVKLGGEATNRRDVDLFRAHFAADCRLHCGLGSTETGVVRHFVIDGHTPLPDAAIPLGYPVNGVEVRLLGEDGVPVASGEVGEIVVRSRFISRGYWHRADLTASVMGVDPDDPEMRIYRSGDLGVMRPDGCLIHRGRKDHQVKIRGNRVELPEIENHLRDLPGVAHAAVVVRSDERPDPFLAAYLVAAGNRLDVGTLRAALGARLPEHMVPSVFVFLDALPQTPNGKIDRLALPAVGSQRPELAHPFCAPRTPLEVELCALWAGVLGVDLVGVTDDFFQLGGTSLIAARLMQTVATTYQKELPLAVLIRAGTVEKFAAELDAQQPEWSPVVPMRAGGARTALFCIHPGGGNVLGYKEFVDLLSPEQPVYGIQAYGVIEGQEPHDDIPAMAAEYVTQMRKVQPQGPYQLGGESFGGLVAYEMACQLQDAGERVSFLFLGDTWRVNLPGFSATRFRLACLTYPLTLGPRQWLDLFRRKVLRRASGKVYARRYTFANDLHRRNSEAHRRATDNFKPRRFRGDVVFFRAQDYGHEQGRLEHYLGAPTMGWERVVDGKVEVHWLPDEHYEMMHGKNAAGFAATLQRCIDVSRPA